MDANGNVTEVWTEPINQSYVIKTAATEGGAWLAPVTISGATTGTLYPNLALNANGDAGVVYSVWPPDLTTRAEYVFRKGPNETWTAPTQISEAISATAWVRAEYAGGTGRSRTRNSCLHRLWPRGGPPTFNERVDCSGAGDSAAEQYFGILEPRFGRGQ